MSRLNIGLLRTALLFPTLVGNPQCKIAKLFIVKQIITKFFLQPSLKIPIPKLFPEPVVVPFLNVDVGQGHTVEGIVLDH